MVPRNSTPPMVVRARSAKKVLYPYRSTHPAAPKKVQYPYRSTCPTQKKVHFPYYGILAHFPPASDDLFPQATTAEDALSAMFCALLLNDEICPRLSRLKILDRL